MKRTLLVMALAALMAAMMAVMSVPAFAVTLPDNTSQHACFGQARADGAANTYNTQEGQILSERQGDNAASNADYRAKCLAGIL